MPASTASRNSTNNHTSSSSSKIEIRSLTTDSIYDIQALADVYAVAFFNNPAYHSIFLIPDTERERKLRAFHYLFFHRIRMLLSLGNVFWFATESTGGSTDQPNKEYRIVGGVGIIAKRPTIWTMLSHFLSWPWKYGLGSILRALHIDETMGDVAKEIYASNPTIKQAPGPYEITMMAVHPDFQGRDIGSQLLQTLLHSLQRSSSSSSSLWTDQTTTTPSSVSSLSVSSPKYKVPLILNTQNTLALNFYRKHGFILMNETVIQQVNRYYGSIQPFTSWTFLQL